MGGEVCVGGGGWGGEGGGGGGGVLRRAGVTECGVLFVRLVCLQ